MGALNHLELGERRPLRVAAYCRISKEEEGEGSYENQRQFFLNAINDHPGWKLAGVFGDYAVSGTGVRGRTSFMRLMRKAEAGQVDYIITKSISRFSRSAADSLHYLRRLARLGVGVYFMTEGIDSRTDYGEMVLSALSSIAEMESESISENVSSVFKHMNAQGTPLRKARYGFVRSGRNWVIEPKQALRIKLAFLMAANGFNFTEIATRLNQFEYIDRSGREWNGKMVKAALVSETYIGDILTNVWRMTEDEDGRKEVKNDGVDDQYYIENHHDPIVGKTLFREIREMALNGELAGQENFKSVEEVSKVAARDRTLDEVRKYLPRR